MDNNILPGDVILFEGKGFISRQIKTATTTGKESRSKYNHVGVGDGTIFCVDNNWVSTETAIEALDKVKRTVIPDRIFKNKSIAVYRCKSISHDQRLKIKSYALKQVGKKYGWWKIGLHLGDYWLSKLCRKDVFFFRKAQFTDRYPICSWLLAYAYDEVNYRFGIDPKYAQPDDIADWILDKDKDNWELVIEYVNGE